MLTGIRVLDLSRLLPGPACTWLLQGLGAAVDRVEPMGVGDYSRVFPPMVDGVGAIFASVSRGKRSMSMEMRHPDAGALIRRLASGYDVVVEGFKPGVLEAIGVDPHALTQLGDGIIVARLSGYGQTGPMRTAPGHDLNYLGLAGVMSGMGHDEKGPITPVIQVADMGGAMVAAMAIAAALVERNRTGTGRVLDVSLTEAALAFMAPHITTWTAEGREPHPGNEMLSGAWPVYGSYRCKDGQWVTLGALEPKFQAVIAERAGGLERDRLAAMFACEDRDYWVTELASACVGPVLAPSELSDYPQHAARASVEREGGVQWVRAPFDKRPHLGAVPTLGEHTDDILREAGYSDSDREAFRSSGLIQ